jgi:plasmid segregation protein ParM
LAVGCAQLARENLPHYLPLDFSMNQIPIVRAADVGYGHVKFTDGRDSETNEIRTDSIPSQSPAAALHLRREGHGEGGFSGGVVMRSRDTFRVPVGERTYEVGRDVHLATVGTNVTEVLDRDFAISDAYAARLFGAINYMLPSLPDHQIDILVLGLPLTTYQQRRSDLEKRFVGTHVIDDRGATVKIDACCVYPQPLGSYAAYIASAQGLSEATISNRPCQHVCLLQISVRYRYC